MATQCGIFHFKHGANRIAETFEVFAPALAVTELSCPDHEAFLIAAINYANHNLAGTSGANILIHTRTLRQIGQRRFEEIITNLHYGMIAINAPGLVWVFYCHKPVGAPSQAIRSMTYKAA